MIEDVLINTIILGILMLFSAFFSGSETAFSALSKVQIFKIRSEKSKSATCLLGFIDNPSKLFITVLFGNILVNIAFISIVSSLIYNDIFHGNDIGVASAIAISIELVVLLLLGEITPKSFALRHAERFARTCARPLHYFSVIILPFSNLLKIVTNTILLFFGIRHNSYESVLTSDDFKAKIQQAEQKGAINSSEEGIIANIFDLCTIEADQAMVPRNKIVCINVTQTLKDAFTQAKMSAYSRLPVYRENIDSICGIFNVKDYLQWAGKPVRPGNTQLIEELTIEEFISKRSTLAAQNTSNENTLIRPPVFAYKHSSIGELIRELTNRKRRMVILLDEYGGVDGLITLKDIIDEVVGDLLDDENTIDGHPVTFAPDDRLQFTLPGPVSLRSLQKRFGWKFNRVKAETFGGYVLELFGTIPATGTIIIDRTNGLSLEILLMDGNRVASVKVSVLENAQ